MVARRALQKRHNEGTMIYISLTDRISSEKEKKNGAVVFLPSSVCALMGKKRAFFSQDSQVGASSIERPVDLARENRIEPLLITYRLKEFSNER